MLDDAHMLIASRALLIVNPLPPFSTPLLLLHSDKAYCWEYRPALCKSLECFWFGLALNIEHTAVSKPERFWIVRLYDNEP